MKHNYKHQNKNLDDWQKLPVFLRQYPQFQMNQLRTLLLKREVNGLARHIKKIGKPLYINTPGFLSWIEQKGGES
ncbi:hypothetical protein LCGC14_1300380 [marine sediment metagenome]|uniref:Uncharacterized protein n=1 Tax=marine sediment metagenome TaxID=412755 RepID=A0A0F9NSS0_9ZZZZ|nr:hypothetical protein [Methylophaga sp.]